MNDALPLLAIASTPLLLISMANAAVLVLTALLR